MARSKTIFVRLLIAFLLIAMGNSANADTLSNDHVLLKLSRTTLVLKPNGPATKLIVTNLSSSITATNVRAQFFSTRLDGHISQIETNCTNLEPQKSCELILTAGARSVPKTAFLIQGDNTSAANAYLTITNNTFLPVHIGDNYGGGIVACLGGTAVSNLIVASVDNSRGIQWAPWGTTWGGSSTTDGAANTTAIVTTIGSDDQTYAASVCSSYQVDSAGNTPCQVGNTCYTDWFLPATTQTTCLYTNRVAIGNFSSALYWTSTEQGAGNAWSQALQGTSTQYATSKAFTFRVRCVRSFTPPTFTSHSTSTPVKKKKPFFAVHLGDHYGGGIVACLTNPMNLITASVDNSTIIQWGAVGTTTNATSSTAGAANSATILSLLGTNNGTYAASVCANYEIDSAGNSPCQSGNTCYNDWYLPAINELNCLYTNRAAIGNLSKVLYWSSTETAGNPTQAWTQAIGAGGAQVIGIKLFGLTVRCVRAFTPPP